MKVLLKAGVIDVPNLCFEMDLIHRQVPGLSFFCGFWIFFLVRFFKKTFIIIILGPGLVGWFCLVGVFCFEFDLFWSDFWVCFFSYRGLE